MKKRLLRFVIIFSILIYGCSMNNQEEKGITNIIFTKDYRSQKIEKVSTLEFSKDYYAIIYSSVELSKMIVTQKNLSNGESLEPLIIDVSTYSVSQFYKLNGFYAASITPNSSKGLWEIIVQGFNIDGDSIGTKSVKIEVVPSYNEVSFNSNGGTSIVSQSVELDAYVMIPETPIRNGYTFEGWYSDEKLTTKFDFSTKITRSITLYAKWLLKSDSVSCSAEDFSEILKSMDSETIYKVKITDKLLDWSKIASIGNHFVIFDLLECTETIEVKENNFQNCNGICGVKLPSSIEVINKNSFYNCRNLKTVELSTNLKSIDDYCFYVCENLESILIPNTVESIGNYAFYKTGLKSVSIPNSVTNLGEHAFAACKNLTTVTLSNKLQTIKEGTFADDSAITEIDIPYGVKVLEKTSFYGLSKIETLNIPDSVTTIGYETFMYWRALKSVIIPTSVTKIESLGFGYCTGLTDVYYKGSENQWKEITIVNDYSSNKEFLNATRHYNYSE